MRLAVKVLSADYVVMRYQLENANIAGANVMNDHINNRKENICFRCNSKDVKRDETDFYIGWSCLKCPWEAMRLK